MAGDSLALELETGFVLFLRAYCKDCYPRFSKAGFGVENCEIAVFLVGSIRVTGPFVTYKWAMASNELHGKDSFQ